MTMNSMDSVRMYFSMFLMQLPSLVVCLVAVVVVLFKGRQSVTGSLWALLGFGLALFLGVVIPVAHVMLQQWVMNNGSAIGRTWAFGVLSLCGSILHAGVYLFLLLAILAGRPKSDAALPPTTEPPRGF